MTMMKTEICKLCPLFPQPFVPPEGDIRNCKMVVIGEAPGQEEVRVGAPFVGRSGKVLRSVLESLGVKEGEVYITNTVKCRPPNNRTPTKVEVDFCAQHFLFRELLLKRKNVPVLALGQVPKEALGIGGAVREVRGRWRETAKYGKVMVTWHPAFRRLRVENVLGQSPLTQLMLDCKRVYEFSVRGEEKRYVVPVVVSSAADVEALVRGCSGGRLFGLDFEATGLNPFEKGFKELCYSVATEDGKAFVVDLQRDERWREVGIELLKVLCKVGRPVVFNAGYDGVILKKLTNIYYDLEDLQFLYYLTNGGEQKGDLSLKALARDWTEYGDYGLPEEQMGNLVEVDRELLHRYCATDAMVTVQLFKRFRSILAERDTLRWSPVFGPETRSLLWAYDRLVRPVLRLVIELRSNGIAVDERYFRQKVVEVENALKELRQKVIDLVGADVNLNSPKQVLQILKRRGIDVRSTGKDALEQYEADEFVKLVLDWRVLLKLRNTYLLGLLEIVEKSETGLVHAMFSPVASATGRLGCSEPNLMNIPTRSGPVVETGFVSRFGDRGRILKADLSQHELRVAALYSGDKNMIEVFRSGRDLHTEVAMKVYGLRQEELGTQREKELRRIAKGFNFGVIYGRSGKSIAAELGLPLEQGEQMVKEYFSFFNGLREWLERVKKFVAEEGYVRTMFGRVRFVETDSEEEKNWRSIAVNTPVQSAASDIAVCIAYDIIRELESGGFQSKVVNFIHDAILVDCLVEEVEEVKSIILKKVKEVDVPVEKVCEFGVDIEVGPSWGAVTEV